MLPGKWPKLSVAPKCDRQYSIETGSPCARGRKHFEAADPTVGHVTFHYSADDKWKPCDKWNLIKLGLGWVEHHEIRRARSSQSMTRRCSDTGEALYMFEAQTVGWPVRM